MRGDLFAPVGIFRPVSGLLCRSAVVVEDRHAHVDLFAAPVVLPAQLFHFPGVILRQPQPGIIEALCLGNSIIHDGRALCLRHVPAGFHAIDGIALRLRLLRHRFELAAHRAHVICRNILIDRIPRLCYSGIVASASFCVWDVVAGGAYAF